MAVKLIGFSQLFRQAIKQVGEKDIFALHLPYRYRMDDFGTLIGKRFLIAHLDGAELRSVLNDKHLILQAGFGTTLP